MVKLKLQCKAHPDYTAKKPPPLDCHGCQALRLFMIELRAGDEYKGVGGFKFDAIGALDLKYVEARQLA